MTDEPKVVPLRPKAEKHFEYVTLAQMKGGARCVCVKWKKGDPLHCYSLAEAAALAHRARADGDSELAAEVAQALNDIMRCTET